MIFYVEFYRRKRTSFDNNTQPRYGISSFRPGRGRGSVPSTGMTATARFLCACVLLLSATCTASNEFTVATVEPSWATARSPGDDDKREERDASSRKERDDQRSNERGARQPTIEPRRSQPRGAHHPDVERHRVCDTRRMRPRHDRINTEPLANAYSPLDDTEPIAGQYTLYVGAETSCVERLHEMDQIVGRTRCTRRVTTEPLAPFIGDIFSFSPCVRPDSLRNEPLFTPCLCVRRKHAVADRVAAGATGRRLGAVPGYYVHAWVNPTALRPAHSLLLSCSHRCRPRQLWVIRRVEGCTLSLSQRSRPM